MSDPNQLPPGRVPVSAVEDWKQSEILPKHKAIILYWMWNADEASKDPANANDKDLINRFAPGIAQSFSCTEHKILLSTASIRNYYLDAKENARDFGHGLGGHPWDVWTVASIIKSQVNDQETYTEVSSFLEKYENVSLGTRPLLVLKRILFLYLLSFCAANSMLQKIDPSSQPRKLMAIVLDTVRRTSKMLRDCWNEADSSGMAYLDPNLQQIDDFNPVESTLGTLAKVILDEASRYFFGGDL